MEAVAQDFGDSAAQSITQVGTSLANQYTMLAAIVLVLGIGLWFLPTFLNRLKEATGGHGKADSDGLRDFLDAKFTDLGHQVGSIKEDVSELKSDFKEHAAQDREALRDLYNRTERQLWTPEERNKRRAGASPA